MCGLKSGSANGTVADRDEEEEKVEATDGKNASEEAEDKDEVVEGKLEKEGRDEELEVDANECVEGEDTGIGLYMGRARGARSGYHLNGES
ncbi:hypothetical protein H0H81_003246 [Sphagnurus paluster]|uniref:Uncharacterized protein n=1 Tax=Sphagnurus paluster TaxID=117069 RepID=A0A9P7GMM0_9AGAR|nr:hypothetical protein H0H81_003246 [Sphagnurus paluster]